MITQNKKRYIIYRNNNTKEPDEIIETEATIQAEVLNQLAKDTTITRVDLEIDQTFRWENYLELRNNIKSTFVELAKTE